MNNERNVKILSPFVLWCQKVIPLAFDESLSYYECLCALYNYVTNELTPAVNNNADAVTELQNFVKNYFDNLDVQEEINNKLDEMVTDGTLDEIINHQIFDELNNKIDATNERIDEINESTLLHVTDTLPEELQNNNQYEEIKSENDINIDELPVSYFENLYNAEQLTIQNENDDVLKVGTFNISNSDVPYTSGVNGLKKTTKLQNIFNKLGCNILGLNEVFDGDIYPASEFLKTEFLKYYEQVTTWSNILPRLNYGEGILSHIQPQSTSKVVYNSYHAPDHQGYVKNVYSYNNKIISFYCTHLCYNDNTTLQNQITELFNAVQTDNNPYKIIVGDFNFDLTQSSTYLSSFLNNGYKLVNGGQYKTYDDNRNIGVDEIMISSNIDILSSGVGNREYIEGLSDHFPLWSTLKLR